MSVKRYDLIVIGSGPAGIAALEAAREAGAGRVAVIEAADRLGGECPNTGCVPTKALLRTAEVMELARRAGEFGLEIPEIRLDFAGAMRRKDRIVDSLTSGGRLEGYLESLRAELVRGRATFVSRDGIEVSGQTYEADRIVIAAGSETVTPPVEGLAEAGYLTHAEILSVERVPESLLIIGGGPIGIEFAHLFAVFGSRVELVEIAPRLVPREDEELAAVVEYSFRKRGIGLHLASRAAAVRRDGGQAVVQVMPVAGGEARELSGEMLLVAAGKRPALRGLRVEKADIELDGRGAPVLNEYLQTTNPAVYVAGDAAGQMMYTHVAHDQGYVAGINAIQGNEERSDLSVIPRVIFCRPEIASVGLTEKEAGERGHDVIVGRGAYSGVGKGLVTGQQDGLVKLVADRRDGKLLGGHILGEAASELIHEIALAMKAGLPYTAIAGLTHAYPTFAEAVGVAAYGMVE
ncbi:hypothetical protein AMJ57_03875 [Parcubacteria bacterium SG8_24]|nr:MAG: hypothetical protein AMJ57_03875 [Parcubacteria bacterium SG8_24]